MAGRPRQPLKRSALAVRLGSSVRAARMEIGVSQERLAERAGISKNYVGNIERGEYDVTVSSLKAIASALNRTAAEILQSAGI